MKTKLILESWRRFLKESVGVQTASQIYDTLNDKFQQDFNMVSEDGGFAWEGVTPSDIDDYMSGDPISGFAEFTNESDWEWQPSIFENPSNINERDKVFTALYFMIHGDPMIEEWMTHIDVQQNPDLFENIKEVCTNIIFEYGLPAEMATKVQQQADNALANLVTDKQIGE